MDIKSLTSKELSIIICILLFGDDTTLITYSLCFETAEINKMSRKSIKDIGNENASQTKSIYTDNR